jgi:hypothetical protein
MMIKKLILYFLIATSLYIGACKKIEKETQICLHDSSIDYMKRWAIVSTQIQALSDSGEVKKDVTIYPNGYFQINSDFTYNLYSDDAPVNGKWNINKNCQFVLNPNTEAERRFSVDKLSADSLVISEYANRTLTTQHYAAFTCPSFASIEYRWDNVFTLQTSYNTSTVSAPQLVKTSGYFKLNADASYNVFNASGINGSAPSQQVVNGTWGIAQPGCLLVLDKNKPNEISYDVQKLTTDSLVIWRKDTIAKKNFLQHYSKHK